MEENLELDHFIYGSYKGYCIKAKTGGIDEEALKVPFNEKFIPIAQQDFKYVEDVRAVIPFGEEQVLVTRLYQGAGDDYGRGTVANHTVIVPRNYLKKGSITLVELNDAMKVWEDANPKALGDIPKFNIKAVERPHDVKALKDIFPRETVEEIMGHFSKNKEAKVYIRYKARTDERIQAVYNIVTLTDFMLKKVNLSAFSDLPYMEGQGMFNLIISRVKINMTAGGNWIEVDPNEPKKAGVNFNTKTKEVLSSIYGD